MTEFEQFWACYPRRVGKLAAMRQFEKARKFASLDEILDGVTTYTQMKPAYADWCHPQTFLSQGRWMDEPDQDTRVSKGGISYDCPHTPKCVKQWDCGRRQQLERAG